METMEHKTNQLIREDYQAKLFEAGKEIPEIASALAGLSALFNATYLTDGLDLDSEGMIGLRSLLNILSRQLYQYSEFIPTGEREFRSFYQERRQ